MNSILILITAITFYFIGRLSNTSKIEDTVKQIKHNIDKRNRPKPGILPFKTKEELEDIKTGEKALDDHWLKTKGDLLK